MKRLLALLCCLLTAAAGLTGCQTAPDDGTTLRVVATLFPQYDFARRIAGERAQVTLLMPPGVESHSFDPAPADIVTVQQADVFLYTGPQMESWAEGLIASLPDDTEVIDLSQCVVLSSRVQAQHADDAGHDHGHLADPHIWTSPVNAMKMVSAILEALCKADPEGSAIYRANAQEYQQELQELDEEFRRIVNDGQRRTLAFSGRFALHYFAQEYGLSCVAALEACSGESEPSAQSVAQVISTVREQSLPAVYYEELSDPKVGRSIAAETGARLLLFHSCHNLSKDEFERGETYLSLMRQNAENLKVGLGE